MTRHRQQYARGGAGYAFNSDRTRGIARNTTRMARENEKRVPCPDCGLLILPAAMHIHRDIVHGDDDA